MGRRTSEHSRTISNIPQKSHNFSIAPGFEGKIFLTSQGQISNFGAIEKNKVIKTKYNLFSYGDIFEELKNGVDERSYIEESEISILKVANVKNNEIVGNIAKISNTPNKGKLYKGDFLITRKGTVGESAIFGLDGDYFASSEVFIIKLKEKVNNIGINKYFVSLFNNFNFIKEQFKQKSVGAIMPSISQPDLKTIQIPLPPLEIQNEIVQKMDEALKIKQQKEAEAKNLLTSIDEFVLSELGIEYEEVEDKKVFGIALVDLLNSKRLDPKGYSEKFRNIKKSIEKSKFNLDIFENILDEKISGDWGVDIGKGGEGFSEIKVLRNTNFVNEKNLDYSDVAVREIDERKISKIELQFGDILIEKSGGSETQPVGRVAIFDKEEGNYTLSNFLQGFRVKKELDSKYVFVFLKTLHRLGYMEYIQNQTTGIRNLITENFLEIKIPLPPLETQNKIAHEVSLRIEKAKRLESEAREIYESAKREVESMILES